MTGLVWLVVALVVGTAIGLLRKGRDGRVRKVRSHDPHTPRGVQRADALQRLMAEAAPAGGISGPDGAAPVRATLLQFSSAFCQPCVATRRVLAEVTGMLDGVHHVEVDAEAHLEEVRSLGIMRTPTVIVVDSRGREFRRASGQPRKADVIAALGALL